jgi:hypothetical protein
VRERLGQDYCAICGTAATFHDAASPICGSSLCEAAFRLPAAKAGLPGAEPETAENQIANESTLEGS